jgi:large subunit ribosomal protein L31
MKKNIHPKYFPNAKVHCTCGNVFEVGSTKEFLETEICYKCHPFYTGVEKIIRTSQVQKFLGKLEKSKAKSKKANK